MTEVNSLSIIENTDMTSFKATMSKIGQFQKLVRENLQDGKDYGTIPGTHKPTLYKPGAEKILMLMGLQSTYEIIDSTRDWKEGFFQYQVRCTLKKEDSIITQGLGCCNSKENKYAKQNPFNIDNTILKMAKKRSQVDASLTVASLSEIFTQDLEDTEVDDEDNHHRQDRQTSVNNSPAPVPNNNRPSKIQMKQIYGEVVCEDCGVRVFGFKCPKCENSIKNEKLHVISLGFLHSHLLTKADIKAPGKMTPAMDWGKLTKTQAIDIYDWWIGSKEKLILGERKRREEGEGKPKPTKADKIKQAREIVKTGLEVKDDKAAFPDEGEDFIAPEDMPE